jgi:hypothetical protein
VRLVVAVSIASFAGCSQPRNAAPADGAVHDAAAQEDAPPLPVFHRSPTAVITGSTRVVWSLGNADCALEHGQECPPESATVLASSAPSATPITWVHDRRGATIAGDENEVFFLNTDADAAFVVRARATDAPVAMSIPRLDVTGPVVDATYVYWAEGGTSPAPFSIRRTSRTGDGTDVELVTTSPLRPDGMFVLWGYVIVGSTRAPVTGGDLVAFTSESDWRPLATGDDQLFIVQYMPPGGEHIRIAAMSSDGTTQTLIADLPQFDAPMSGAYDRGELFWITSNGKLLRLTLPSDTPVELATDVRGPIGVTADAVLHDFTASGYKATPR